MSQFIGGWRFDEERYEILQSAAIPDPVVRGVFASDWEIPKVCDFREAVPRRSQSSEGSCQGHAQTYATELVHYFKTGKTIRFSPDFAYYEAQRKDGLLGRDQGSTITGGAWVAKNLGSLEERYMPYTPRYNPQDQPIDARAKAAPFQVANFAILRSYRDIVEWYARGLGACWWGIRWGLSESSAGWVTRFTPGRGGHAIGIGMWGYKGEKPPSFSSDGLPDWLWQTNSWTNNPQEVSLNGFCRITRQAVEAALADPYTVCVGVTDMPQLKPRRIDFSKDSVWA